MLMVAALVLGIALVPVCGGRLGRLVDVTFRHAWLIALSFALQLLITTAIELPDAWGQPLHIASYVPLFVFLVLNRSMPGVRLVMLGAALNVVAIAANGGTMPANPGAVHTAGIDLRPGFDNSAPVDSPNLALLGDIFAVPAGVPFANVFSFGDVAIVAGGVLLVHRRCGSFSRRRAVALS